jgi:hypothetical protein
MSWTKQQLIEQAFEEAGLAAYVFDLTPDQLHSALRRLDSMMATLMEKGIILGYPIPGSPQDSNLSDESNIPDYAVEAVYLNLAIRIAPSFGKSIAPETKTSAKSAMDALLVRFAFPNEQQFPYGTPAGAGAKTWRLNGNPFLADPVVAPITNGGNGQLIFNGE